MEGLKPRTQRPTLRLCHQRSGGETLPWPLSAPHIGGSLGAEPGLGGAAQALGVGEGGSSSSSCSVFPPPTETSAGTGQAPGPWAISLLSAAPWVVMFSLRLQWPSLLRLPGSLAPAQSSLVMPGLKTTACLNAPAGSPVVTNLKLRRPPTNFASLPTKPLISHRAPHLQGAQRHPGFLPPPPLIPDTSPSELTRPRNLPHVLSSPSLSHTGWPVSQWSPCLPVRSLPSSLSDRPKTATQRCGSC